MAVPWSPAGFSDDLRYPWDSASPRGGWRLWPLMIMDDAVGGLAGSVPCLAGLCGLGSGEQVADRGGEDADRVVLIDLAGPDLVRAGVHEREARGDQPPGGQVGPEGAVCLPAF